MIRYLVFDLDETIYPRDSGLMKAINDRIRSYMVNKLGFDPKVVEKVRRQYYLKYGTSLRGLMLEHGMEPEDYLAYVHDIPLEKYIAPDNHCLQEVLSQIPLQKVIFTNATREHAGRILRFMGIEGYFSRIVDIRDLNYVCKPAPEAFERLLTILDARGEECVLVEDNLRNLQTAKTFGMTTVLVDGEGDDSVDFVIQDVAEIGQVIGQLCR